MKTGLINWVVFKTDITRHKPIWGIYCGIMLLHYLMSGVALGLSPMAIFTCGSGFTNFLYAGICALALYGDVLDPHTCYTVHAMPLRRESWFLTHGAAGLLFSLVPNMVVAILAAPVMLEYWYMAFLWLAVSTMRFVTFFGIAAFCVMIAGNKLGMGISYVFLNFWTGVLKIFLDAFYMPLLYGVKLDAAFAYKFTPLAIFYDCSYFRRREIGYGLNYATMRHSTAFVAERWDFLRTGLLAAVGLMLLFVALIIYRRRKSETAGMFMVVRPLAFVVRLLFCVYTGSIFCLIGGRAVGFIGIVLGYFIIKMLQERKFNIFRLKTILSLGGILGVMVVSLLVTSTDPFGVTQKLPDADQVSSVKIWEYRVFGSGLSLESKQRDGIEAAIDIQQRLIREEPNTNGSGVAFKYEMQDGTTFVRYYPVDFMYIDEQEIRSFYSSWEVVFDASDWADFCNSITHIEINPATGNRFVLLNGVPSYVTSTNNTVAVEGETVQLVTELLESMKKESDEGRLSQFKYRDPKPEACYYMTIYIEESDGKESRSFIISNEAAETVACIETCLELFEE